MVGNTYVHLLVLATTCKYVVVISFRTRAEVVYGQVARLLAKTCYETTKNVKEHVRTLQSLSYKPT
jgi:hypothetical protein